MILPSILGLPSSTRWPASSVTSTVLKAGSRFSVKKSESSRGAVFTVLPTRGSARSRRAWAWAVTLPKSTSSARLEMKDRMHMSVPRCPPAGRHRAGKKRLADAPREKVVEINVHLSDHTDIGAALTVDRNDSLDADL